ncbi:MAG: response regulator [Oscillatoriales cyanobacterium SM2_3_0]|nr:response regulator [Oscillatoriales cyanobacterium SM2_3_0]
MRILLVEGHQSPASLLLNKLTASGYIVDFASNSRAVLELIASCDYDLIVLDAEALVPQFEGINLCRHLRSRGYDKLILLLIPENSSLDSVAGLDAGADDCIIKPYKLPELLAKIRALLRRRAIPLAPCDLIWGDLQMNLLAAEVIYQDQAIALTAKEYSLLKLFLSNPQRIFSRNAIIDQLWPLDASPGEGAVTNMIKNLRQKLKSSGVMEELLETVYGLGYRLKAPPRKSAKLAMRSGPSLTPGSSPEMPPREHRSETINPQTQQCYQLLVIDDDWEFIKQLKTEASGWGFQIEYITDTTLAGYWIAQHSPDLVLIDLSLIKPVAHHLVPELVAQFPRSLIILSVDRASLDERLMMSRLGIHYFLHKSVISISQIFGAALQVLSQFDPAPTRVMVIDEDSSGLEDQKKLLQLCGSQVDHLVSADSILGHPQCQSA